MQSFVHVLPAANRTITLSWPQAGAQWQNYPRPVRCMPDTSLAMRFREQAKCLKSGATVLNKDRTILGQCEEAEA